MQNIGAFANLRILTHCYFNLPLFSNVTAENFKILKQGEWELCGGREESMLFVVVLTSQR